MRILITGGAGFIGSCILRSLNNRGWYDLTVVDDIRDTDKWKLISDKRILDYFNKDHLSDALRELNKADAVIHMGACSSTTERDFDYLYKNNFEYTKTLWNYCADHHVPFIYASSAATYGNGSEGFDDKTDIDRLRPLNAYGYSKQLFDLWVKHQADRFPPQHVGLKFFNVYGPNEYYKGTMASMVYHGFDQIKKDGVIKLFRSYDPDYRDGEQLRDFVYVKDVCDVVMWFLDHPDISGLFNVGTGRAQSFRELAEATFKACGLKPDIRYVDMPKELKEKYQYYTQADIDKLRSAGYDKPFCSVEEGVRDYVQDYLDRGYKVF